MYSTVQQTQTLSSTDGHCYKYTHSHAFINVKLCNYMQTQPTLITPSPLDYSTWQLTLRLVVLFHDIQTSFVSLELINKFVINRWKRNVTVVQEIPSRDSITGKVIFHCHITFINSHQPLMPSDNSIYYTQKEVCNQVFFSEEIDPLREQYFCLISIINRERETKYKCVLHYVFVSCLFYVFV